MRPNRILSFLSLLLSLQRPAAIAAASVELPVVDLGYELHQAIGSDGIYYNFSNIPFAAAPVGDLRFAAPVAPQNNRATVNVGGVRRACLRSLPAWALKGTSGSPPPPGSEDCLYLDVMVPKTIFDGKSSAPVMVYIFGGGYVAGDKQDSDDVAGLLAKAATAASAHGGGDEGVIWVAINYRLGTFGWLAGRSFEAEGGVANLGLLDQRMALQWVQDHIPKFGGDPKRVTVFGDSAGGGSIIHHITAYGGAGDVAFSQAYAMSPGWAPIDAEQQDATYREVLSAAGVKSLKELRSLDTAALLKANAAIIYNSSYGSFTFGPVVDGNLVPDVPLVLLRDRKLHKEIKNVMVSHDSNEGALFADPSVKTDADFDLILKHTLPFLSQADIQLLEDTLYPSPGTVNSPFTTQAERIASLSADAAGLTCATGALSQALAPGTSYSYIFGLASGAHSEDVAYVYYNRSSPDVINATVADILQSYVVNFALNGKPDTEDFSARNLPPFPAYGENMSVLNITERDFDIARDPTVNGRCFFWQNHETYGSSMCDTSKCQGKRRRNTCNV